MTTTTPRLNDNDDDPSRYLKKNDLLFSLLRSKDRNDPNPWKFLLPALSIEDAGNDDGKGTGSNGNILKDRIALRCKKRLNNDGYVLMNQRLAMSTITKLKEGIKLLHETYNIPPTFILLFDETWDLAYESYHTMLSRVCHTRNQFNYDILAWYIPRGKGGFSPHRDRQPKNAADTFHTQSNGSRSTNGSNDDDNSADGGNIDGNSPPPMFATQWIALSDATPENSCLYVIPKQYDPGYIRGDDDDDEDVKENEKDTDSNANHINGGYNNASNAKGTPLQKALPTKESYQHIRALPRKSGQSVIFSHRIIHWGSQSTKTDDEHGDDIPDDGYSPRIAISFVCSDPSFEPPLLVSSSKYSFDDNHQTNSAGKEDGDEVTSNDVKYPPFGIRLLLVCSQLLIYYQRFDLSKDTIKACYDICKEYQSELDVTYRQKVFVEFVNAMKEIQRKESDGGDYDDDNTNDDEYNTADTTSKSKRREVEGNSTSLHSTNKTNGGKNGVDMALTTIKDDNNDYYDDDEDDAVMEEMLNAEAGGYGEFEDDYDELEDDVDCDDGGSNICDVPSDDEEEDTESGLFSNKSSGRDAGGDEDDRKPPAKKIKHSK